MIWIVVILTETPRKKTYIFETHALDSIWWNNNFNMINNSKSSVGFPERELNVFPIPFIDKDSITCPGHFNF